MELPEEFVARASPRLLRIAHRRVVVGGDTVLDTSHHDHWLTAWHDYAGIDLSNVPPGQPVEISALPAAAHGDWLVMLAEKD
ncbi:hypothetical protein [Saccharothrix sp.]|uniref:hypothetical protein n=1 Tax=Saccharothrix sp. TaxID=1873460 RepID=UPI002811980C|nr:hypothetical protein [Saccharothrix sp.]